MSEKPRKRLRASELTAHLLAHPIERGEIPERPAVRVRDDTPSVEVTPATPAGEVLGRLDGETDGAVVKDEGGNPKAVVLTPERYAELAMREAYDSKNEWLAKTRTDRMEPEMKPSETMLRALMIEPVDPNAEWKIDARPWPDQSRAAGQPLSPEDQQWLNTPHP